VSTNAINATNVAVRPGERREEEISIEQEIILSPPRGSMAKATSTMDLGLFLSIGFARRDQL
jgi:hypothetical protein